jgi:Arc/MetJ-type ribon-helix-helix transcriptional regulator
MSKHVERDYTTASIPLHLADRVKRVLPLAGYQSLAEFVRDAVRRRLEELEEKRVGEEKP